MKSVYSICSFYRLVSVMGIASAPFCFLEGGWSAPVQISSTTSDQPSIALDPSGNAVLVWQGYDGQNYIIQASDLPTGGNWSSPVTLSAAGQNAQSPGVSVDYRGNAVAVWSRYDGWNSIIQGASKPLNGNWTNPSNISDAGQNADSPKVSMNPYGTAANAVAVWHRYNGFNFIMQASNLPSGGSWSAPASISVSGQDALVPVLAVDPNGNAAAVCSRFDGTNFTSRAAAYLSGLEWSSSFIISTPGQTALQQSIGMDASGNSIIAWSYFDGQHNVIQVSALHFGDGWTTPVSISTESQDSFIPQVVMDAAGNATVLWVGFDGINYIAQAATLSVGGSWSAPAGLSQDGGDVNNISLAVNAAGHIVAVWDLNDGANSIVQSAVLPANGTWSSPVIISTTGQFAYLPVVSVDPTGNAVAAWLQSNGSTYVVNSSSLPFGE